MAHSRDESDGLPRTAKTDSGSVLQDGDTTEEQSRFWQPQAGLEGTSSSLRAPESPESPTTNGANVPSHDRRRSSVLETQAKPSKEAVAWKDLPHKQQLVVIVLTRLSEPLVQTSLQSYMFYQLKSFDPSLPDSVIAGQAGVLHASFTAAQLFTAMIWGRLADSSRVGRKKVIMIGLLGTMISVLGFGFSTSFWQALTFRSLGGITNGNVGVLRTMVSELVPEKKYQQRAFVLLPMTFNIGVIIGPILGGLLADPANSYPNVFGKIELFHRLPYVLPNLVSAFFLLSAVTAAFLFLEETLDARAGMKDYGIELGKKLTCCFRKKQSADYQPLATDEDDNDNNSLQLTPSRPASSSSSQGPPPPPAPSKRRPRYTQRLAFRRMFTRNVIAALVSHSLLAFHVGTFNSLWFVFLSTPVYDPSAPGAPARHLPFVFTGGIGLPPARVGLAMSILGVMGITLQLFVYPALSARLGTLRCLRLFLLCFPLTYFLVPYLALVPSTTPAPAPKSGPLLWIALAAILCCQVVGRTFALPNNTILVNNASPHPSILGTFHGFAQSCTSAARTVGPMCGGYLYGLGLAGGVVGGVWWGLSAFAAVGWLASWFVRDGDGHEIWLEGDEVDGGGLEGKDGVLPARVA